MGAKGLSPGFEPSSPRAMLAKLALADCACSSETALGGLIGTIRLGAALCVWVGLSPLKVENDETAISPTSGDKGLVSRVGVLTLVDRSLPLVIRLRPFNLSVNLLAPGL